MPFPRHISIAIASLREGGEVVVLGTGTTSACLELLKQVDPAEVEEAAVIKEPSFHTRKRFAAPEVQAQQPPPEL